MRKRRATSDNNRRSNKKRRTDNNEENRSLSTNTTMEDPQSFEMANLPLEILGNLIFKYFTFDYWLKSLSYVSKQWYQAAIQSNADKQLFIVAPKESELHKYYIIAARYKVTAIILRLINKISIGRLAGLLSSSPKLHTFVYPQHDVLGAYSKHSTLKFPFIKTAFVHSSLLTRFPNATRVQLADDSVFWDSTELFPNVEELAVQKIIDTMPSILKGFPSLKVLHIGEITDKDKKLVRKQQVEVRISSMEDNKDWRKYYSLDQLWGSDLYWSLMEHATECYVTKYTAKKPHPSVEYEIGLLERHEDYQFPAITDFIPDVFCRRRSVACSTAEPPVYFCKHLALEFELTHMLLQEDKKGIKRLLQTKSQQLFNAMKPPVFAGLIKIVAASELKKVYSKEQLERMMKLRDHNGTIVQSFIALNYDTEDLDKAIENFGPLPEGWQTVETNSKISLVQLAGNLERYDWIEYLVNNGVKIDITKFFLHASNEAEDDNMRKIQNIIRLTHKKNAYLTKTNWLFDSDWSILETESKIQLIDFFVEEFKINLNEAKQDDEFNANCEISFVNHLIESMWSTDLELFNHVWEKYKLDINRIDGNRLTPLLTAIQQRMPDIVVSLLEKGAATNLPKSNLPLYLTVADLKKDVYEYIDTLLAYGADINEYCDDDVEGCSATALLMAIDKNQPLGVIKYLIVRGAKADLVDSDGLTAMHYAAINGRPDLVQFLAKYVDVNKVDKEGTSALHYTVDTYVDSLATIEALLKHGADVNQVDESSMTPLMKACSRSRIETIEELLKHNVDIKARDRDGRSFVYHLARNLKNAQKFSSKEQLLKKIKHLMTDDNIAFVIEDAKQVLAQATKESGILLNNIFNLCTSSLFFAEFLIEHVGFNIDTQNSKGDVSLSYPMNKDVFDYLMTKNPNVNIQNSKGNTPVMFYQKRNNNSETHKEMLDALIEQSKKHPALA